MQTEAHDTKASAWLSRYYVWTQGSESLKYLIEFTEIMAKFVEIVIETHHHTVSIPKIGKRSRKGAKNIASSRGLCCEKIQERWYSCEITPKRMA
jgi:hypothetical protein